ncbi:Acetyltransferase (GNAT) domain-containing protein [Microbulbifer donghaiensis]|uniref:Acetyltransferase (GNAT) domain-containing protein n=1 Tax=Microbulbifer donghaiensis TaxID=494016 RepID=A0A1M5D0J9_9GAMM|nr:GNAT family N-acetyltransferase [Microbulbifer donghaiensis]SHF60526.1 Acetyltransferase (GNAT) domain-containing protein [Microbulbifer donghaiensis]
MEEINDTRTATRQASPRVYSPEETRLDVPQDPLIERSVTGARTLLESWERTDHNGAPRVAQAAANFYLPSLPKCPGHNTPHIVLWEKDGLPDGILIGHRSVRRSRLSLAKIPIPMPRLRRLEVTTGGLETHSRETARRQAAYLRRLLRSREFDCITICNLPLDSEIGRILNGGLRFPGDGKPDVAGHWFTELTDERGHPIVSHSAKTRGSFRRMDRKLCKLFADRVELREFHAPDQVKEFISAAARIGECSYQHAMGVGVQNDASWREKLRLYADYGSLRAYLLVGDGKPLAYAVGALWGNTYSGIATSFLPEFATVSPGGYLLRRMIEQFQQAGIRWFDLGVPDYDYKKVYGTLRREVATFCFFATTPAAKTATLLDSGVANLRKTVRRLRSSKE